MNRRGIILPLVLLGILATVAVIPFMVTNTETITKNIKAIDESNRIYWAADGAACDAYLKSLKSNSTLDMASLTIDIKDENIVIASSPRFQYNNFVATTTLDTQSTIHEERACWVASASAEGYDFGDQIKAVYVKPGVTFNNDDGYAWDKNGILYRVKDNKNLAKVTQIKEPIWQMERNLILTVDGKVRYYSDGSENSQFSNNSVVIDTISNNKYYRINKDNNVLNSSGQKIKWKNLLDNNSGELDDVVQIDGRYDHIFALKSNGELYGWGNNKADNYPIIRKLGNDGKTIKTSYSDEEAILIKTQNAVSNSVYDITYFINKGKYLSNSKDAFFEDKFGMTPHYCKDHNAYNDNCNKCKQIKEHPWTENTKSYLFGLITIGKNCKCELCNEIRDISLDIDDNSWTLQMDPRSKHTDKCHCSSCNNEIINSITNPLLSENDYCRTKREHYWGCHCDNCEYYKNNFYSDNNWRNNKSRVPNPSTPLHLEEDTKIIDLQLLVDGNSAFFTTESYYNKNNVYQSSVEFRAKFVPKNPPTTKNKGDVGTYKTGGTTDNLNEIYLVEGGIKDKNTTNKISNLPNVWIIKFGTTIKKGDDEIEKLPKGDYEVIFESRLKIEDKLSGAWSLNAKTTQWKTIDPYNMLWGVDKNNVTNNNIYLGCIFRLNEYLFNVTSGNLWEPHKVCAVSAGELFSVILAKNTDDAIVNKNKYKIMSWGYRGTDNKLGRVGYLGKQADTGAMGEVVFDGDDKNTDNYVAKNVRSIKTGKFHTLVFTDYKDKNNKRIQELWTWGANKFAKPKKLTLDLDAPIVSIACGDTKNLLITENNTVYQWGYQDEKVNSNHIIPRQ